MNKTLWEKASKLLYHFCENGFTEESIKAMIPEFGNPTMTMDLANDDPMVYCIDYGPFSVWVGCDGNDSSDYRGTHVEVRDDTDIIHLINPTANLGLTDGGLIEITEGLKNL